MKKVKAIVSMALAATVIMTACGNPSGGSSTPAGSSDPAGAPAAKPESIRFLTKDYYTIPDVAQMLSEQFVAATGVNLEIQHVPQNNWEDKVTASFVSGDLPDIARLPANIYPFVKQDFLLPLNDYIDANPKVKAIIDANPELVKPMTFFGKIYGISNANQKFMNMWIRTDWLEKLGIEAPTNMDELVKMLELFRDSDLDGNGKNDTIPLTLSAVLKDQDMFAAAFNTRNQIYLNDGKAVVPFTTPEYKEYMDFMKKLYSDKLLDLEMPTNTAYGAVRTKFMNGQAAAIIMWDDIYDTLKNGLNKTAGETAGVTFIRPFETEKGIFGLSYYEADSPMGITTACKNPQAVFDTFFTWFMTDPNAVISTSRGIEGYHFDVKDGVLVPNLDNSGVGYRGQSFPPIDKSFDYPFKFDPITQTEYDGIKEIAALGAGYGDKVKTTAPSTEIVSYSNLVGDLRLKTSDLFHNYVMGKIDYDKYLADFNAYAKECSLEDVITEINK